jgi:hypothetical protein
VSQASKLDFEELPKNLGAELKKALATARGAQVEKDVVTKLIAVWTAIAFEYPWEDLNNMISNHGPLLEEVVEAMKENGHPGAVTELECLVEAHDLIDKISTFNALGGDVAMRCSEDQKQHPSIKYGQVLRDVFRLCDRVGSKAKIMIKAAAFAGIQNTMEMAVGIKNGASSHFHKHCTEAVRCTTEKLLPIANGTKDGKSWLEGVDTDIEWQTFTDHFKTTVKAECDVNVLVSLTQQLSKEVDELQHVVDYFKIEQADEDKCRAAKVKDVIKNSKTTQLYGVLMWWLVENKKQVGSTSQHKVTLRKTINQKIVDIMGEGYEVTELHKAMATKIAAARALK